MLQEHGLAHKEVAEVHAQIDPVVQVLLVGQFNTQTNGEPISIKAASVRGLQSGQAAGDGGVTRLSQGLT